MPVVAAFTCAASIPEPAHRCNNLNVTQGEQDEIVKHTIATVIASLHGMCVATVAFAQSTPVVDQRQANQSARIANGEASGALSKREAARQSWSGQGGRHGKRPPRPMAK